MYSNLLVLVSNCIGLFFLLLIARSTGLDYIISSQCWGGTPSLLTLVNLINLDEVKIGPTYRPIVRMKTAISRIPECHINKLVMDVDIDVTRLSIYCHHYGPFTMSSQQILCFKQMYSRTSLLMSDNEGNCVATTL